MAAAWPIKIVKQHSCKCHGEEAGSGIYRYQIGIADAVISLGANTEKQRATCRGLTTAGCNRGKLKDNAIVICGKHPHRVLQLCCSTLAGSLAPCCRTAIVERHKIRIGSCKSASRTAILPEDPNAKDAVGSKVHNVVLFRPSIQTSLRDGVERAVGHLYGNGFCLFSSNLDVGGLYRSPGKAVAELIALRDWVCAAGIHLLGKRNAQN